MERDHASASTASSSCRPADRRRCLEGGSGADGRFFGAHRVTVESVPRLPTFPAAWTLDDPRRCAYLVFWTGQDGSMYLSLRMEQIDGGQTVQVSMRTGDTFSIKILRQPLPSNGAASNLYRCPWCWQPRRYLYPLTLIAHKLVDCQGPRCRECAGLRWASQGTYRSAAVLGFSAALRQRGRTRSSMPREPWDPRAVSHPRLLAVEFPALVLHSRPAGVPTSPPLSLNWRRPPQDTGRSCGKHAGPPAFCGRPT